MTREDHFTNTPEDAAAYERARSADDVDDRPTRAEAERDEAGDAPCNMLHEPPMDFAWCETHDETFPLGAVCPVYRGVLERNAVTAHALGHWSVERLALDALALDERARAGHR
jgi:hypothetical protein